MVTLALMVTILMMFDKNIGQLFKQPNLCQRNTLKPSESGWIVPMRKRLRQYELEDNKKKISTDTMTKNNRMKCDVTYVKIVSHFLFN